MERNSQLGTEDWKKTLGTTHFISSRYWECKSMKWKTALNWTWLVPRSKSNLWILSVAIGFMEIQCLNWKIIGQCLGAEHSARNPLLNEYNHPLTDIRLSQPIFPVSRRVDNSRIGPTLFVEGRIGDLTKLLSPAVERRLIFKLRLQKIVGINFHPFRLFYFSCEKY